MSSRWKRIRQILKHGVRWRLSPAEMFLRDINDDDLRLILEVKPFTMTSPERLYGLINAVRYVARHKIPGVMVECGVWKGGSMMAVARTLLQTGETERDLYLFDTFAGMTAPSEKDSTNFEKQSPRDAYASRAGKNGITNWSYSSLDETRRHMAATGYPDSRIHFVKGPVEETIPREAPEVISLLRLDTDFYESTRHELIHLFPRLSAGGVLIIDDYGHWEGARTAIDEYMEENRVKILLNRVDYTGRIAVKL